MPDLSSDLAADMSDATTLRESQSTRSELDRTHTEGQPSHIKNPKKPKTRPPRSLRDSIPLIKGSLPYYTGPYSVVCVLHATRL